jgi:hypothetical protein
MDYPANISLLRPDAVMLAPQNIPGKVQQFLRLLPMIVIDIPLLISNSTCKYYIWYFY